MPACRSCGKAIRWVKLTPSNKPMPIDPRPTPDGNVVLLPNIEGETGDQLAKVLSAGDHHTGPRYTSHFATCPHADRHRRK